MDESASSTWMIGWMIFGGKILEEMLVVCGFAGRVAIVYVQFAIDALDMGANRIDGDH